jgi:rhodanese-related sulfurtransferase
MPHYSAGRAVVVPMLESATFPGSDMSIDDTLKKARDRAKEMRLPYEGALTPAEAHEVLTQSPDAKIVDVRTRAELDWVGRIPDAVEVELLTWPGSRPNPDFVQQLEQQVDDKDAPVLFICRSGGRSHNAAMLAMQAGFREAYNVLEGFEGDKDGEGHRNTVGGWRAAGLPWTQS